jgi:hypothetical protein
VRGVEIRATTFFVRSSASIGAPLRYETLIETRKADPVGRLIRRHDTEIWAPLVRLVNIPSLHAGCHHQARGVSRRVVGDNWCSACLGWKGGNEEKYPNPNPNPTPRA